MKIQAIKKLCLRAKRCNIMTGQQGQQWIGTNSAIFRVDDGLRITADSIKGLFDLTFEQSEGLQIEEYTLEVASIWPMMRYDQNKMKVCPLGINNYGGVELLAHGGKMYLCGMDAIKAAVDKDDYREYWLGYDRFHAPLIIVRDGMLFAGVIRPMNTEASEYILKALEDWSQLQPAGFGVQERDEAQDGQQMSMEG